MAKDLEGKKVLAVIAPRSFRDEELFDPKAVLEARGAKVTVASTTTESAKGMLGGYAQPDRTIEEVKADDYDAVFVVGGMGSPQYLWQNSKLHDILRDTYGKGKPVAGICLSGAVHANAGILEGKRATVYRTDDSVAAMRAGGANYTGGALEVDGNVVTAEGPAVARKFGEALGDVLAGKGTARKAK